MKIPKICTDYLRAYIPRSDIYAGPNSETFTTGVLYENWVPNDHIIVKGNDNCWHAYGITHPSTINMKHIHEAEWQSFHAATKEGNFRDFFKEDSFEDKSKILYPQDRPNEDKNQHSPAIVKKDGLYYMFYGPKSMRYAISKDMYNWEPKGTVFEDVGSSRDPHIFYEDGVYYMTYCVDDYIVSRTSKDLINWSDRTVIFRMRRSGSAESPVLLKYEDLYYLIWCIWDEKEKDPDPYDPRSYVYASKNIMDFNEAELVAQLYAHCPEILIDEFGDYYISSAHKPYRGINIAKLEWVEK